MSAASIDPVLVERFEKYISPEPNSGCWLWAGYVSEGGYGRFSPRNRMAPLYAHRFSYELHKGQIPEGMDLDHLCRVRCCVNPDHLEPVTRKENIRRGLSGINNSSKTRCDNGHPFSPENIRTAKTQAGGTVRVCRQCERRWGREKYARSKERLACT